MKSIQILVDKITDELNDAKCYAEKYLELKAENDAFATKFKGMSEEELKHANIVHDYAVAKIAKLREVYTPPESMVDEWNKSHTEFMEQTAWIRVMLTM